MKKAKIMPLVFVVLLLLSACGGGGGGGGLDLTANPSSSASPASAPDPAATVELASSLNINYAVGHNLRTLTYNHDTPLAMPDGSIVQAGDLKPMWAHVAKELGFDIVDVSVQDQRGTEMMEIASATGFTNANVYGGAPARYFFRHGPEGYFINLKDYMSQMPNLSAYLEENPNIEKALTAYDGNIYHVAYIAEIGNYARVVSGRESWVKTLLDGDGLEPETQTLKVAYNGYWHNRRDENVVDLQNQAAAGGTLNRDTARQVLIDYIKKNYPDLANPSDLFLGSKAQYDVDELIALWRVVKLSPNTLSKVATGSVVDGAVISPFFARDSRNRDDILRLVTYFGGQRVFGTDSFETKFYLDANGEMQYSFVQDGMLDGFEYIRQLYSEGLIFSEFANIENKDPFRNFLFANDKNEGQKQFGFMNFDWIASNTAMNKDVVAFLPPLTTVGSDEMIHFIENTRSIKPESWAISSNSSETEINAALKLFDYMFSPEGHITQNYGLPIMLDESKTFKGPDGVDYPAYTEWVRETAVERSNGDLSTFLRDFIGSQMPIGYQKEIGFEYQYTVNRGWDSWEIYQTADVKMLDYEASNPLFRLMPTDYALTEQEQARLTTTSISNSTEESPQVGAVFLYITGSPNGPKSKEEIRSIYEEAGIDTYMEVYRAAFAR